jgi:hypothetical protein
MVREAAIIHDACGGDNLILGDRRQDGQDGQERREGQEGQEGQEW